MELFIQAKKAIRDLLDTRFKNAIYGAIFLFIIIGNFSQIVALIGISILFAIMVFEDYFYQTVDIRLCTGLILIMLSVNWSNGSFGILFLSGMLLFGILYHFSIKKVPMSVAGQETIKPGAIPPLPFLPSIALGIVIWEGIKLYGNLSWPVIEIRWTVLPILAAVFFMSILYKRFNEISAAKQQKEIVHGFGDGDILICAAWLAFLGVTDFFMVYGIAVFLQLGWFIYKYIYREET